MKFKSVNELDKFSFQDCEITKFEVYEDLVSLELEALIVLPKNSQNTNFTKSYAGTTTFRLTNGKLVSGVKEGYRYRDANGKLISETPDRTLTEEELKAIPALCVGKYLYDVEPRESMPNGHPVCDIDIEFPQAEEFDTLVTDSYRLTVVYDKAIFEWDFYQNKVQE